MQPYYEQDGIRIFHGDCREVWAYDYDVACSLNSVFITDPPYGVELGTSDSRGDGHGLAKQGYASYLDTFEQWVELVPPTIKRAIEATARGACFTGKHLTYLPQPATMGGVYCPAGVGRNPWGYTNFMPVFFYGCDPQLQHGAKQTVLRSSEVAEVNGHPCPKPEGWMRWLVNLVSLPTDTVVDPFMGSGTTLVAAKRLGRKAVGIEIDERYCEIAAKRLSQGALPMEFSA